MTDKKKRYVMMTYRFLMAWPALRANQTLGNMVGERGFEPPTHWSQTSCATKLRYSPRVGRILLRRFQSVNGFLKLKC